MQTAQLITWFCGERASDGALTEVYGSLFDASRYQAEIHAEIYMPSDCVSYKIVEYDYNGHKTVWAWSLQKNL